MQLLSVLLVGAGFCCLFAGWYFSRLVKRTEANNKLCRGIISHIDNYPDSCILTVSFSSPKGTIFHHRQQVEPSPSWYEGMPLLIRYRYEEEKITVLRIQGYQEAYGKAFGFLLAGILLIICGAILL